MPVRAQKKPTARKRLPVVITGEMFFKYDACPHWNWFDRFGDPKKKGLTTKFSEMLLTRGLMHEESVIAGFKFAPVKARSKADRFKATLRLMRQGAPLIYHGLLLTDGLAGEPDLLERDDSAPSLFGPYHYVAVDIKSAERFSDAHKYQLSLYGDLLEAVQGVKPRDGWILNASGVRLGFGLREFEADYREALAAIRAELQGECPAPHLSSGCKQSPWFKECVVLAEAEDDIALLYNVKTKVVEALRANGVRTVKQVAAADLAALARADERLKLSALERLQRQAQALLTGRHEVREPIRLPDAAVEYFFDIEGDPLRQVEYLFGFLVRRGAKERYEFLLAERPEDEPKLWKRFLDWVENLPESAVVYHYGSYEKSRLTMLESRYGGSSALDRFRDALVDLNEIVKECVIFPLYFYGLKNIGEYLGFERGGKIAGGGESVAFYEEWLAQGDRRKLEAILKYNEDDVVATRWLKDWLLQEAKKFKS